MPEYWIISKGHTRIEEPIPDWVDLEPVHDGYGYYGILSCEPTTGKVQCHVCGGWYESVGHHVKMHGYRAEAYKADFELSPSLGLCSNAYWERMRDHALEIDLRGLRKDPTYVPDGGHKGVSLHGTYANRRVTKSDRFSKAVSQAQVERFKDPAQLAARKKHMDRIRPLSIKARKERPYVFTDEHKKNIRRYQANRTEEHRQNAAAGIRAGHEKRTVKKRSLILAHVTSEGDATPQSVAAVLQCHHQTAARHLRELVRQGQLARTREGYKWIYSISEEDQR